MREIIGETKTVRGVLAGTRYAIDYYQREYAWQEKQVRELIEDLSTRFLLDYEPGQPRSAVAGYAHYFLGSIIISKRDYQKFIVDGQQRLTTLTLLLIVLRHCQQGRPDASSVDDMIYSEQYGHKTFNVDVEERAACMDAIFHHRTFDDTDQPESVQNIIARYHDIETLFPEELSGDAVPYFVDWLKDNVHVVEITAYTDDDAYTIFETMNDRGLNLSMTDMLKGYLLANISDSSARDASGLLWKTRVAALKDCGKEVDADFFKAWLRSQYAKTNRERHKGAIPEDYDRVGSEYHRWVREKRGRDIIGLSASPDFVRFIQHDFDFFSRHYLRLLEASTAFTPGLEHVYYIARMGFTTQYQLLLAPLTPADSFVEVDLKFRLVGIYLDILLNRRIWNWHTIGASTMQYAMFLVLREIRHQAPSDLAEILYRRLTADSEERFTTNPRFGLHQQNQEYVRLMLARLTDYVERQSGLPSHYVEYVTAIGKQRYEVEHIWANKSERHIAEFPSTADFAEYRNRIGDLLLLPKSFNASYGALSYEDKVPHYDSQNLLARSLNPLAYEHNPGFLRFAERSGLNFRPFTEFHRAQLDARQELYARLAECVWDPDQIIAELER